METNALLLGLLLFLAAAGGYFFSRYTQRRKAVSRPTVPPAEFFRGLDHLLRDDSDKALTVLQNMANADPGVVEVHFALATLCRKRGETDRAIRIHQNLLARPDLARRHREQALYDLAEDYLKAGLYDRAEALYVQLHTEGIHRPDALERLISIYERQRDWDQAIVMRRKLAELKSGPHEMIIAHYHCEEALIAREQNDLVSMRDALKKARASLRGIVRGALMRADLAILRDDMPLAVKLYRKVLESDPSLCALVLKRLQTCYEPDSVQLEELLNEAIRRNPAVTAELGKAALATGLTQNRVAAAAARDLLKGYPVLKELAGQDKTLERVSSLLQALGLAHLEYCCRQCGYQTMDLHWQCPACQTWDSSRPDIRMKAAAEAV